jgi:3-methyladenine DNA glycosylase AlkC
MTTGSQFNNHGLHFLDMSAVVTARLQGGLYAHQNDLSNIKANRLSMDGFFSGTKTGSHPRARIGLHRNPGTVSLATGEHAPARTGETARTPRCCDPQPGADPRPAISQANRMTEKVLLKDLLFNDAKVERIAGEIHRAYPSFSRDAFSRDVVSGFPQRELKARIAWIAECLKTHLPDDYPRAVGILVRALPPPNDPKRSDDDFGDFIHAPYSEFVARNGCTKAHLRLSLDALREITQRFSAEDAIRHFINAFPKETLHELLKWSGSAHYHVRRLCSEGTRPKLPWSRNIDIPVDAPLPILDRLVADRTRYVTRSVANHVNDISKIDPDLALTTLGRWKKTGRQTPEEMDFIVRHALRTLIKQGHPKAMKLLGLDHSPPVRVSKLRVPAQVEMNTALEFSFSIRSEKNVRVLIDYTLHFQNKAGKPESRKVFKLTAIDLETRSPVTVSKRHMLREKMTTRTLYPGRHMIDVQVNGKTLASAEFLLKRGRSAS